MKGATLTMIGVAPIILGRLHNFYHNRSCASILEAIISPSI